MNFGFVAGLGVGALVGIAYEEISPLFAQAHGIDNIVLPRAGKKTVVGNIYQKTAYTNEYLRSESS